MIVPYYVVGGGYLSSVCNPVSVDQSPVLDWSNPPKVVTNAKLPVSEIPTEIYCLEECGRYLETIKVYENKPADSIREQMDTDYLSRLTQALTSVRHVNKTDAVTLGTAFGSLSGIMDASLEDLARCPGIGERKVKRLYDTFHEPFRRVSKRPAVALPETPTKDAGAEEILATKEGVEVEGEKAKTSKNEKESGPSVRSALTAAFAKYSDRVAKRDRKGKPIEQGESSNSVASKELNTDRGN